MLFIQTPKKIIQHNGKVYNISAGINKITEIVGEKNIVANEDQASSITYQENTLNTKNKQNAALQQRIEKVINKESIKSS